MVHQYIIFIPDANSHPLTFTVNTCCTSIVKKICSCCYGCIRVMSCDGDGCSIDDIHNGVFFISYKVVAFFAWVLTQVGIDTNRLFVVAFIYFLEECCIFFFFTCTYNCLNLFLALSVRRIQTRNEYCEN